MEKHHKNILHDPEVKASGLMQDHVDAIQTITDAIGHHEKVYDALVKKHNEPQLKPGDHEGRVIQAITLMQRSPAFAHEFESLMEQHHPLPATHPLAKHLKK